MQQEEAEVPLASVLAKAFGRAIDGAELADEALDNLSACFNEAVPVAVRIIASKPRLKHKAQQLLSLIRALRPDPSPNAAYEALSAVPVSKVLLVLKLLEDLSVKVEEGCLAETMRTATATLIVDLWAKHLAALAGYGQEEVLRAQRQQAAMTDAEAVAFMVRQLQSLQMQGFDARPASVLDAIELLRNSVA